jgi:hypothetical protein
VPGCEWRTSTALRSYFIVALVLFILSLVNLARGTRIALHDFDHHLQAWIITYELAGAGEG